MKLLILFSVLSTSALLHAADNAAPSCHDGGSKMVHDVAPAAEVTEPPKITTTRGKRGEYIRTITFGGMHIHGLQPSMRGPWARAYLKLFETSESPDVWITGYRAEVLDKNGVASQEFMCHTNLDLATVLPDGGHTTDHSQLSISQGQEDLAFPAGFGLKLTNAADKTMDLNAMVLNNNYADLDKEVKFKAQVTYLSDKQAKLRGLKPLEQTAVYSVCTMDPAPGQPKQTPCATATEEEIEKDSDGRRVTGHWLVPPGHQEITSDVTAQLALKGNTRAHYIWMHVHPFATSLALRDVTSNKMVWQGKVQGSGKLAVVKKTDRYISSKGLELFKDHKYELTSVYDNPTDQTADAMAALWMYVEPATADKALAQKN